MKKYNLYSKKIEFQSALLAGLKMLSYIQGHDKHLSKVNIESIFMNAHAQTCMHIAEHTHTHTHEYADMHTRVDRVLTAALGN